MDEKSAISRRVENQHTFFILGDFGNVDQNSTDDGKEHTPILLIGMRNNSKGKDRKKGKYKDLYCGKSEKRRPMKNPRERSTCGKSTGWGPPASILP